MSKIIYFFKESLTGFSRNLSTALGAIVTIFLSLFIIGVFMIGGIIVENVISSVEDEVSITVWLADEASDDDIATLKSFIEGLEGVAEVGFTDKDQALENFRSTSSTDIIDSLDGTNPLPRSLDVELSDPQSVDTIADTIEANETFLSICDTPDDPQDSLRYGEKTVERLFSFTKYVRFIILALICLLIFIALVFINNTIRLAIMSRRKEISIMRLVGASNGFIRGPFLMEGALHSIIGALLAIGSLQLLIVYALPRFQAAFTWLPIQIETRLVLFIYLTLLVAGLVIGFIGASFAMRRYMKV